KEIARAFLVPEPTMAQRLTRAKRKIRATNIAYRLPDADELATRLAPVLATIYLIFTEGHTATAGTDVERPELTSEALRLARTVAELLPSEPEAVGLLALILLTLARSPARTGPDGEIIRLADQDRRLWNRDQIAEGHDLVGWCIRHDDPGPYQLQAAIAAVHAAAPTAALTDWEQIIASYDQLFVMRPTAIVALNRAIAVMEHAGPDAALAELAEVDLPNYYLFHATRAEALERSGRSAEAASALRRAMALTANTAEIEHLQGRLAQL
ncbi:MAG: RNA polymerase sigma factor, partial [Acidimicrobiales bacterium]